MKFNNVKLSDIDLENEHVLGNENLSPEEQGELTPLRVVEMLKEGNREFANNMLTIRNNTDTVRNAALGQYPKAVVISCLDSRIPVEDIFHQGIGEIFSVQVAGNIINRDILGSLEYACKLAGSKVVFVLGHEYCGAIKAAIQNFELGNITSLLTRIRPVVHRTSRVFAGEKSADNPVFIEAVCYENVRHSIHEIRKKSYLLKDMEIAGELIITGGVYDMESGKVDFLPLKAGRGF